MPASPAQPPTDEAFAAFLQQALPELRAFVRRLCHDAADADDVVQETLAKVWRLRGGFDAAQNGRAWLQQAAFRCFCDHRRRRAEAPPAIDAETVPAAPTADAHELADELRQRLQRVPALERALLLGFHRDGHSLRELADRHGLPVNTVKSHLHRARLRLQGKDASR